MRNARKRDAERAEQGFSAKEERDATERVISFYEIKDR